MLSLILSGFLFSEVATPSAPPASPVPALLDLIRSGGPKERRQAEAELRRLGPKIRDQLMLKDEGNPELRDTIQQILADFDHLALKIQVVKLKPEEALELQAKVKSEIVRVDLSKGQVDGKRGFAVVWRVSGRRGTSYLLRDHCRTYIFQQQKAGLVCVGRTYGDTGLALEAADNPLGFRLWISIAACDGPGYLRFALILRHGILDLPGEDDEEEAKKLPAGCIEIAPPV